MVRGWTFFLLNGLFTIFFDREAFGVRWRERGLGGGSSPAAPPSPSLLDCNRSGGGGGAAPETSSTAALWAALLVPPPALPLAPPPVPSLVAGGASAPGALALVLAVRAAPVRFKFSDTLSRVLDYR